MTDHPARSTGDEPAWGSPLPAEYGSLELRIDELEPVEDLAPAPPSADRLRRITRSLRAARRGSPPAATATGAETGSAAGAGTAAGRTGTTGAAAAPPADPRPNGAARKATTTGSPVARPVPAAARAASASSTVAAPVRGLPEGGGWASVPAVPADDGFIEAPRRDRTPRPKRAVEVVPESRRRSRARQWPQSRWMVRHFDVWSVVKISVAFYLLLLVAFVVASVLLWYLADAFGAVTSIEKSARTLFSLKSVKLHPAAVAKWTAAGGAVLCVAGTLLNILAALTYNLISDLVGGIRFDVVDRDGVAAPAPPEGPRRRSR